MKKSPRDQRGQARVKLPERYQVEMQLMSLDQMVREDDFVRTVVGYVETVDLSVHPENPMLPSCNTVEIAFMSVWSLSPVISTKARAERVSWKC